MKSEVMRNALLARGEYKTKKYYYKVEKVHNGGILITRSQGAWKEAMAYYQNKQDFKEAMTNDY